MTVIAPSLSNYFHPVTQGTSANSARQTTNLRVRHILPFYVPKPKDQVARIWERQRAFIAGEPPAVTDLPEDERVEDAGLDYEEPEGTNVAPDRRLTSNPRAAA